jgi:hypothetical protein
LYDNIIPPVVPTLFRGYSRFYCKYIARLHRFP